MTVGFEGNERAMTRVGKDNQFERIAKRGKEGGRRWIPRLILSAVLSLMPCYLVTGQEGASEASVAKLEFREACWFIDELATALIFVDAVETPVITLPQESNNIRFYGTSVVPLENDERGTHAAVIEFMPLRTGVQTFPSIHLVSDDLEWASPPKQFLVGAPHETPKMHFEISPVKTRVYEGEPLRFDFTWQADYPLSQLRALRLSPSLFSDPHLTVVVPRSVDPDEEQIGLPVGGRRVIGRRIPADETDSAFLGKVTFSIFAQYEKAGWYEIPRTRLLCSRLLSERAQSNQYAAYFNNNLFELVDRNELYEKIEAYSKSIAIEVLALPAKGRLESFSGLFAPESITVSVNPRSLGVGQLMEIRIDVRSSACSEMLSLPQLNRQSTLRSRFWIGPEVNEIWQPNGRTFVARARPLTTAISTFPSLSFQVFDPEQAAYRTLSTDAQAIDISPIDGKSYFAVGAIPGATYTVSASEEGVWHNYKASLMNDLIAGLVSALSEGAWIFFFVGPLLWAVLGPRVRESRRRMLDEEYRRRKLAYQKFQRDVGEKGIDALRDFVAASFGRKTAALTGRDAALLLRKQMSKRDVEAIALVERVESMIETADEATYNPKGEPAPEEENLKDTGSRVFALLKRTFVALFALGVIGSMEQAEASDWNGAERAFEEALDFAETSVDSIAIEAKFAEAALQYEACAVAGERSGLAYYNAGNAWFQAGEVGRAIASYRRALDYRPFDQRIATSLESARALQLDGFSGSQKPRVWSVRWTRAAFSFTWLVSWIVLLFWIRYRGRALAFSASGALAVSVYFVVWTIWIMARGEGDAVLIVDEAYGRKGPSYAYQTAFVDPLHNGLEVTVIEERSDWIQARLLDGSLCWLPAETLQKLSL